MRRFSAPCRRAMRWSAMCWTCGRQRTLPNGSASVSRATDMEQVDPRRGQPSRHDVADPRRARRRLAGRPHTPDPRRTFMRWRARRSVIASSSRRSTNCAARRSPTNWLRRFSSELPLRDDRDDDGRAAGVPLPRSPPWRRLAAGLAPRIESGHGPGVRLASAPVRLARSPPSRPARQPARRALATGWCG